MVENGAEERAGRNQAQRDLKIGDCRPAKDRIDGDVGAKRDTQSGWAGIGVGIRHVVADDSSEFAVCLLIEIGGVADGADKLDGLEWVSIVELFVGMDNLGVCGDDPSVECQVTSGHGGASVVQTIEGDGASSGSSQVECDGGKLVIDPDREWFWARAGRGSMLEQFDGYGGEADSLH
jgi:hypothetical protein